MLIECILKRKGGTTVDIGSTEIHFRPDPEKPGEPHLAEVRSRKVATALLSIAEGYRAYVSDDEFDDDENGDDDQGDADAADAMQDPEAVAAAMQTIKDAEAKAEPVVDEVDDDDATDEAEEAEEETLEGYTLKTARARFIELSNGQKPHHKAGLAKIVAAIKQLEAPA